MADIYTQSAIIISMTPGDPLQCIFKHEGLGDNPDSLPPDIPHTLWTQGKPEEK